jgi:hypothetical protein
MMGQILRIPLTAIITCLGIGMGLLLFLLFAVGLVGGALKEVFRYLAFSQSITTKSTSFNQGRIDVLVLPRIE